MAAQKTALITGANRGIGFGFVNQLLDAGYYVIATCRTLHQSALKEQAEKYMDKLELHELDVNDDAQIEDLVLAIGERSIDRLILNAGIYGQKNENKNHIDRENMRCLFETNSIAPLKMAAKLWPAVQKSHEKLIVAITSKMGSIADNHSGGSYAYRASKAALNACLYSFSQDVKPHGLRVLLLHPGWVKTDMGGDNALIDIHTSVSGMLSVMENAEAYSTGSFLAYDSQEIAW